MPCLVHIIWPHRLHKLQSSLLSETIYNLLTADCRLYSKHAEGPSIPFTYVYIMFLFLPLTPSHLFSFLCFSLSLFIAGNAYVGREYGNHALDTAGAGECGRVCLRGDEHRGGDAQLEPHPESAV